MAAKVLLIHETAEKKQLEAFHIKLESSNENFREPRVERREPRDESRESREERREKAVL